MTVPVCAPTDAFAGEWQLRNPSGQSISVKSMAYGKGKYVAFGDVGLVYSSNLVDWKKATHPMLYPVDKISFLNGTFYGITNGGGVLSSADGTDWRWEKIPSFGNIKDIAYGKDLLVAVGDDGIFVAQQVGRWTRISNDARKLKGVAFGNGVFVAVGMDGTMLVTKNGTEWVSVDPKVKDDFTAIGFGGGTFVAVTQRLTFGTYTPPTVLTSATGYSWTAPTKFGVASTRSVFWKSGSFWAVSFPDLLSSSDGASWEKVYVSHDVSAVYDAGDKLVAISEGILTSDDGEEWKATVTGTTNDLHAITYAKGLFVAVGRGGVIMASPDGQNWKEQYVRFDGLHSVFEFKGKFFAFGPNSVFSSSDGLKWVAEPQVAGGPMKAARGKEAIVAVCSEGKVYRSTDGKNWTAIDTGINKLIVDVAYGDGMFVAVAGDRVLRSTDEGKTWEAHKFATDLNLHRVCFGKGRFLLVGKERRFDAQAQFFISENGAAWTEIPWEHPIKQTVNGLTYTGGLFVATTATPTIYSSPDAKSWTASTPKVLGEFEGIAYGNDSFVAVGSKGKIAQTKDLAH
jgi:hypothetical protein